MGKYYNDKFQTWFLWDIGYWNCPWVGILFYAARNLNVERKKCVQGWKLEYVDTTGCACSRTCTVGSIHVVHDPLSDMYSQTCFSDHHLSTKTTFFCFPWKQFLIETCTKGTCLQRPIFMFLLGGRYRQVWLYLKIVRLSCLLLLLL